VSDDDRLGSTSDSSTLDDDLTPIAEFDKSAKSLHIHPADDSSSNAPFRRTTSSHKLNHHHSSRHGVKAHHLGSRTTSFGKNLNQLSKKSHHQPLHHPHDPMAPSASSSSHRPSMPRRESTSVTSPPQNSPRPQVKRNASGFIVPRTATHSALKKNHSSSHLPRHGSSKNLSKRHTAPPMKRTQSSKSQSSQKSDRSQKSDKAPRSPVDAHPHTVRFDLDEEEVLPGQDTGLSVDDDNEWTEDSTSLSPVTTRDHTRQNSVTLDSNILQAAQGRPQIFARSSTAQSQNTLVNDTPMSENPMRRNTSSHSILTPDALTSRLLMRTPSLHSAAVSNISATASATPDPAPSHLSLSQNSTVAEAASSGSGGRDLVSRFLAGGNSHVTPPDLLTRTPEHHSDSDSDTARSLSHRRNKSTTSVPRGPPAPLPPSRTLQKLQLQRQSTLVDPPKKVPLVPVRPTAPLLLSQGINSFGFTHGEEGALPAQIQGLFAQIDKEYAVIRRFRRPVQEALERLDAHRALSSRTKGKGHVKTPSTELRYVKPGRDDDVRPELGSRRAKVAFEIPIPMREGHEARAEAKEICRRMWDLGEVVDRDA